MIIDNKILLVEDDFDIILWIKSFFEEFGYEITAVETATDAISNINQNSYNLLILDLNLPDYSGYEVLNHISKNNLDLPVIVTSAYSDLKNKLRAFNLGAKDYIVKPVDLEELEARIRVHIKQTKDTDKEQSQNNDFIIKNNEIYLLDKKLNLTKTEFDILNVLITQKNQIVKKENILKELNTISSDKTLEYHISNIRKKLGDNGSNPRYLLTQYGVGYKLLV